MTTKSTRETDSLERMSRLIQDYGKDYGFALTHKQNIDHATCELAVANIDERTSFTVNVKLKLQEY